MEEKKKNFLSQQKESAKKHRDYMEIRRQRSAQKKEEEKKKNKISYFFFSVSKKIKTFYFDMSKKTKKIIKDKKLEEKGNSFLTLKNIAFFILITLFVLAGIFFIWFATLKIPDITNFENRKIANSTKIYDKTGEVLLYDIHENIRRTVVDLDNIAPSAKDAIIAIEDHSFYDHKGVVVSSTLRAIFQTALSKIGMRKGGSVGGSTLTQQVIKNTLLTRDKVLSRKAKEWVLAYKIEQRFTKDEILEIYLNEAPYGGTLYGIEEASKHFFGVSASELTLAQSAYLAAIPNLPTYYSPYGPNKDKLDARQKIVLQQMKKYGFISNDEYKEAMVEEVTFLPQEDNFAKSLHFVQYIRAYLEEKYGVDLVQNGGLKVITTLDYELQERAEEIIKDHVEEVKDVYNASNAALMAIDAKTGQILSMVGSRDYSDTEDFDGNFNVTLSPRQPGSSFKPIAYATAFEKGYLPETMVFDTETQFNARCDASDTTSNSGCYSPRNYDNAFKGPISLRSALAESRNIPAVKVNYLAGINNVIQKAKDMGITSLTKPASFYGLGLVLGGGEVSLLEMTSAYSVFATDGIYHKPTGILEVTDMDGTVLEKFTPNEQRVLGANSARMINSILSDNVARTPLFGAQSFLYFGERPVAGKTGTTNDNKDAWLIGYTPDVVVGVWTGNNDNKPMKKGSSISGKPWRQYMDEVLKKYPSSRFDGYALPDDFESLPGMVRGDWYGGTTVYLDSVSGKRATEFTPEESKIAVPQPDPHTILYSINKDNPRILDYSQSDQQYQNWEYGVRQYVEKNIAPLLSQFNIPLPEEEDDIHTEEEAESDFNILLSGYSPENVYMKDQTIHFILSFVGRELNEIKDVQFFINNAFVSSDTDAPFDISFVPHDLSYLEQNNILKVVATDTKGYSSSKEFTVHVQ